MEDMTVWLKKYQGWGRVIVESKGEEKSGIVYARERKKHYLKFAVTAKWNKEILTLGEAKNEWGKNEADIREKIKALCDEYGLELYDNSNRRLGS